MNDKNTKKGAFGRVEKSSGEAKPAAEAPVAQVAPMNGAAEKKPRKPRTKSEGPTVEIDPKVLLPVAIRVKKAGGELADVVKEILPSIKEEHRGLVTNDLVASRLAYYRRNETLKQKGIVVPTFGEAKERFDWDAIAEAAKAVM